MANDPLRNEPSRRRHLLLLLLLLLEQRRRRDGVLPREQHGRDVQGPCADPPAAAALFAMRLISAVPGDTTPG